jgi:hypothetical protein
MEIHKAIRQMFPRKTGELSVQFTCNGTYDTLVWNSTEPQWPKPSEAELVVAWEEYEAEAPLRQWKRDMAATDEGMPRRIEDLYDGGLTPNAYNKKLLDAKKKLRGTKP